MNFCKYISTNFQKDFFINAHFAPIQCYLELFLESAYAIAAYTYHLSIIAEVSIVHAMIDLNIFLIVLSRSNFL